MAWTTVSASEADLATSMQAFEDDAGTSSIDDFDIASTGPNRIVALVEYTAA